MWYAEMAKKVLMNKRNHISAFYYSQSYNLDPFGKVFCSCEKIFVAIRSRRSNWTHHVEGPHWKRPRRNHRLQICGWRMNGRCVHLTFDALSHEIDGSPAAWFSSNILPRWSAWWVFGSRHGHHKFPRVPLGQLLWLRPCLSIWHTQNWTHGGREYWQGWNNGQTCAGSHVAPSWHLRWKFTGLNKIFDVLVPRLLFLSGLVYLFSWNEGRLIKSANFEGMAGFTVFE